MEEKENNDLIGKRKNTLKNFFFGWVEDNYDKAFLGILLVALILRFLVFLKTMDQAIWWDAADYLATAKRWAGANPHLIDMWYYRRGFLWPLFGSLFLRFGLGEVGIRFAVVLLSTGIVAVSYLLVSKMFDKKLALFTSIGITFSWIYLFFSGRPLTNLPATFFLLTSLFFFWKGYVLKEGNKFIYLFGAFYALACLTRMQYVTFAIPLMALVFTKEKFRALVNKHLWIAIGIFLIIFTPQFVMHYQHFGNPITDLTYYYLGVGSGGEAGGAGTAPLYVYFTNLPYILDGNNAGYSSLLTLSPIYLLFVIGFFMFFFEMFLGLDKIFKNKEIQKKFFIFFWIGFTFLLLAYIAPHLEQRYMMQTLPFLFVIVAQPLIFFEEFLVRNFKIKKILSVVLISTIFILLLYPSFVFANNLVELKKTSYIEVKQSGEWIKENSDPTDIIISSSLPQTTYYSERSTYPFNLAYRRDIEKKNITETGEFIQTEKPKYMVISVYEQQIPDFEYWAYTYPQKNNHTVIPVKVYAQGEQPTLIVYEFKYD